MPRYALKVYGTKETSPFELKEAVLRVMKLNEVLDTEIDLFRLQFDMASTMFEKMKVIESWMVVESTTLIRDSL